MLFVLVRSSTLVNEVSCAVYSVFSNKIPILYNLIILKKETLLLANLK